mgnify:CR=1 FL=1
MLTKFTDPETYYYTTTKKRATYVRKTFRNNRLAFRVNREAFRVNRLAFRTKRAEFRTMRLNHFEQSVREPCETFIRFHSELSDNLFQNGARVLHYMYFKLFVIGKTLL